MSSTFLVTGTAGFIGSHLTERLLADGHRVAGIDNFCDFYDPVVKRRNIAKALEQKDFHLCEIDIRDRSLLLEVFASHRPQAVIHLAAMAGVRPSIQRPAEYASVNIDGTINLLEAAVAHGCSKMIFASSSSVYGNNKQVPFAEDHAVDLPLSPYAATKKSAELICHSYWHLHRLPVFCLRLFTVFGPRQRPDLAISTFLHRIRDGQPISMYGDGSTSRDYTYIDDITSGVITALERCDHYRLFNIGGSRPVSLVELIRTIEQVVGQKAKIEQKPMQPGDAVRTWADLTRSRTELGYEPQTTLAEGIERQWAWIRARDTMT